MDNEKIKDYFSISSKIYSSPPSPLSQGLLISFTNSLVFWSFGKLKNKFLFNIYRINIGNLTAVISAAKPRPETVTKA